MILYKVTYIHTGRAPADRMVAALDFPRALRAAEALAAHGDSQVNGMRVGEISQQMDLAAIDVDAVSQTRICRRVFDLGKEPA